MALFALFYHKTFVLSSEEEGLALAKRFSLSKNLHCKLRYHGVPAAGKAGKSTGAAALHPVDTEKTKKSGERTKKRAEKGALFTLLLQIYVIIF